MEDAAAGGHPLHVAGAEVAAVAEAVAERDRPGEHVRDRLDAAMRMPRKAGDVILGTLITKIIEEQERIEVGRVTKAEGALQLHARALQRRLGLNDFFHG